jgi:ribosomal protein L40E
MKCQKCQFDNRDGAKFCGKCRVKLLLVCPQCNSENPPENNFCDECGHDLSLPSEPSPKDLSLDEKLAKANVSKSRCSSATCRVYRYFR